MHARSATYSARNSEGVVVCKHCNVYFDPCKTVALLAYYPSIPLTEIPRSRQKHSLGHPTCKAGSREADHFLPGGCQSRRTRTNAARNAIIVQMCDRRDMKINRYEMRVLFTRARGSKCIGSSPTADELLNSVKHAAVPLCVYLSAVTNGWILSWRSGWATLLVPLHAKILCFVIVNCHFCCSLC